MRLDRPLVDGWTFAEGFDPARTAAAHSGTAVELPHAAGELPLNYFDETAYQRPFT